jgi:outer membrane protein assembly factor BamB
MRPIVKHSRALLLLMLFALTGLSGCAIFGNDDDEELEPMELVDFEETLDVHRAWSGSVGKGTEALRIALSPAGDGERVYAASYDGNVVAFNPENGRRIWRVETDTVLSSGPGVGEGLVVVAGYDGDLVALRAEDGSEVWRVNIAGESLARPIITDDLVIVYTIDGRLRVLSAFDGAERWIFEQALPALTQRGSSVPILVGTTIVCGFDNGRLMGIDLQTGTPEWEAILAPPSGRSDLERLSDVDGSITAVGQDVYAAGYNGRIASLAIESGQVLWTRDLSSPAGVTADWNNIYTVGDQGEIIAVLRRNGDDVWRYEGLLRREPTTPVPFSTAVVVGDFEGYLHFLNNFDGRLVARERVGKGMISGVPLVMGERLFVQSENGDIAAYTVRLPEQPAASGDATADPADEES